jgi:hypothetical protein
MDKETRNLLLRWQMLQNDEGAKPVRTVLLMLSLSALAFFIFVMVGLNYGSFHPTVVVLAAAAMGYVVAEAIALRHRMNQWPRLKHYIDWKRVEEDLKSDTNQQA